ncbi:MAG: hypothetical protein M1814_003980 [Vezdaea aestivalis]|nr:MAG: hypothetical protein M1814_003980 [Vezdaea aestivalis]
MIETKSQSINLSKDGFAIVSRLRNFFYNFDYDGVWHADSDQWIAYVEDDETKEPSIQKQNVSGSSSPKVSEADLPTDRAIPEPEIIDTVHKIDDVVRTSNDGIKSRSIKKSKKKKASREPPPPFPEQPFEIEGWGTGAFGAPSSPEPPGSLRLNARMYIVSDKYDIQQLKRLSLKKFETGLQSYQLKAEKDYMDRMALKIAEAVWEVYEYTSELDPLLRDLLSTKAVEGYSHLIETVRFRDLLEEVPAFCRDVLTLMGARHELKVTLLQRDSFSFET